MSETQEKNKALVRRLYELDARGDIEAMEKLLAPDFVDHSLLPDQDPGREGYVKSVAEEHAIFSNIRHIIEDQVAEGDKVTSRLSVSRIHDRGEHLRRSAYRNGVQDDWHHHPPYCARQGHRRVE